MINEIDKLNEDFTKYWNDYLCGRITVEDLSKDMKSYITNVVEFIGKIGEQ